MVVWVGAVGVWVEAGVAVGDGLVIMAAGRADTNTTTYNRRDLFVASPPPSCERARAGVSQLVALTGCNVAKNG